MDENNIYSNYVSALGSLLCKQHKAFYLRESGDIPLLSIAVYSYNLVKGSWVELPRLTPERGYHGVASVDGEMYVVGGFNNPTSETLDTGKTIKENFIREKLGYLIAQNQLLGVVV